MTAGLAPHLPITTSRADLIQDYETLVIQNLKMLLLTSPGERIMDVNFGVGLRKFLFEINDNITYERIASKIREQVSNYMPFVEVQKIEFNSKENDPDLFPNFVRTSITFKIVPLQITSLLQLDTNRN